MIGRNAALCALALLGASCGPRPASERPKNVVLVVVDTLRADRLSCYGYRRPTTPAIDRLAARGALYRAHRPQGCWTVPSMVSFMSGLYVTEEESRLPADRAPLAEVLQRAGLATAAFVGNPVLTKDRGFERGFDVFVPPEPDGKAVTLVRRFIEWHEGAGSGELDRGFFAWIHPMDPHHPYEPDEDYWRWRDLPRVDEKKLMPRWQGEQPRVAELDPDSPVPKLGGAIARMRTYSNLYDGEVAAVDAGIGELEAYLRASGLEDDTLVIFAADHGEMLWEHAHYPLEVEATDGELANGVADLFTVGHRAWYYEEQWSTPLVLAGPGIPAGVARDGLSANLDVYPTILEALGLAPAGALDGESLFGGRDPAREHVFAYGFDTAAVMTADGFKLVEHQADRFGGEPGDPPVVELFDRARTPQELRNLAPDEPDVAARLQRAIADWRTRHDRDVDATVSEAARDVLEDLGYLGEGD